MKISKITEKKELIRIDRNGTKYIHHVFPCGRCGGSGYVPFNYAQGICFDCHGSGWDEEIIKEYTPEHEAKLKAKRDAKRAQAEAERLEKLPEEIAKDNQRFFRFNGMDENGTTWIYLGDTFSIKDELRAQGAKFNYRMGWHSDHKIEGFPCFTLNAFEFCKKQKLSICGKEIDGAFCECDWEILEEKIDQAQKALQNDSDQPASQHVGSVGEKIEITATFTAEHSFKTHFNYHTITNYIYTFTDESGNVFIWKTTAFICEKTGTKIKLKGTIKAHGEFRNIKQTELMRCKITKEEG